MNDLAVTVRSAALGTYGGLAGAWDGMRGAAASLLRRLDRGTKRNPGLICAVAIAVILAWWLASGWP